MSYLATKKKGPFVTQMQAGGAQNPMKWSLAC